MLNPNTTFPLPLTWRSPVADESSLPTASNNKEGDTRCATAQGTIWMWTGASWLNIYTPPATPFAGDCEAWLTGTVGPAAVDTGVLYYPNVFRLTGDLTVANDGDHGSRITVGSDGEYCVTVCGNTTAGTAVMAISRNADAGMLTGGSGTPDKMGLGWQAADSWARGISTTVQLNTSDVMRILGGPVTAPFSGDNAICFFRITRTR